MLSRIKKARQLLLGQDLDEKVQLYLRKVREGGGGISSMIVIAAAKGILLQCNRRMLVEYGGQLH